MHVDMDVWVMSFVEVRPPLYLNNIAYVLSVGDKQLRLVDA